MDAAGAAVFVGLLLAQPPAPTPAPALDPALTSPTIDDRILEQQKHRLNAQPVPPARRPSPLGVVPGTPAPRGDGLPTLTGRPLAEGSFLSPRDGTLIQARTGELIFVPAVLNASAPREPAMILLPCETLSRIREQPARDITLGGQAFTYRGRNYLLPTVFDASRPLPDATATPQPSLPEPGPSTTGVSPATPPEADPQVADIIRDLEDNAALRPIPPNSLTPIPAPESEATPKPVAPPLGEDGTLLVSRRARIVRLASAAGRFAAVFDNDPSSPAHEPMILLPCRAVERLEAAASWRGDSTPFLISGRTYRYEGRTYLLPVLVLTQRASDVSPMQ